MEKNHILIDSKSRPDSFYLGNPNIKKDGINEEWTLEMIKEYNKCSKNPVYFIETYIKIIHPNKGLVPFKPYEFQKNLIDSFYKNQFVISMTGRQMGKSVTSCAYLLWYALFHSEKTIAILANKNAIAKEMLSRITLMLEKLPFWIQPGCRSFNKTEIVFSNNSKIISAASSSSAIRGLSISYLYWDEASFTPNAEEFYASIFPTISSGKDSRVIICSTPLGIGNVFYRLWQGAVTKTNEYVPFKATWEMVPDRDEDWKRKMISNSSERQFAQEHSCDFLGSGNTLISGNILMSLVAQEPIHTTDGGNLRTYKHPEKDHSYLMTVDVSRGRNKDFSTFNIIDISQSPFEQCCVFHSNTISPLLFPSIIEKYCRQYNDAYCIIESNDNGAIVTNSLFYDLEYDNQITEYRNGRLSIGVEMTKKVKAKGCSTIKDIIEQGKLQIYDKDTIQEICTFVENGRSFEAETGNHDDLMMNLVMFGWFTSDSQRFGALTDLQIRTELYEQEIKEIEQELVPFGIIDDGTDNNQMKPKREFFGGQSWEKVSGGIGEVNYDDYFLSNKRSWI